MLRLARASRARVRRRQRNVPFYGVLNESTHWMIAGHTGSGTAIPRPSPVRMQVQTTDRPRRTWRSANKASMVAPEEDPFEHAPESSRAENAILGPPAASNSATHWIAKLEGRALLAVLGTWNSSSLGCPLLPRRLNIRHVPTSPNVTTLRSRAIPQSTQVRILEITLRHLDGKK